MATTLGWGILGAPGRRLMAALDAWSLGVAKARARQRYEKALRHDAKQPGAPQPASFWRK